MRSGFLGGGVGPLAVKRGGRWYTAGGAPMPLAAYQPKGAASLAASYINLANPGTYNAAPGVAPTLVAGGWQGDGATTYLDTGIVPASGYSMAIRFSGGVNGSEMLAGSVKTGNSRFFIANGFTPVGPSNVLYASGFYSGAIPYLTGGGVLAVAGQQGYRNGVADAGVITPGWDTVSDKSIYILCRNNNGAAASFFSGVISHLAIWNATLTAAQVAAVSAAMAAL